MRPLLSLLVLLLTACGGLPPVPPNPQYQLGIGVAVDGGRYLTSEPMPAYLRPPIYVVPPAELGEAVRMTESDVVAYVRANIRGWQGSGTVRFRLATYGWVRNGDVYLLDYIVAVDTDGNWRRGACSQNVHVVRTARGDPVGVYADIGICMI